MLLVPENHAIVSADGFAAPCPVNIGQENSWVRTQTPSEQTYVPLFDAFNHFNTELFVGKLPNCLVTLRATGKTQGFYHAKRFTALKGSATADEIAMNPVYFPTQPLREIASTLVHEMAHHWQEHFGAPPCKGYHNREWAAEMLAIGLPPSSTGAVGGKQTGFTMSHYIAEGGPFDLSYARLAASGWRLGWGEGAIAVENPKKREGFKREFCHMTAQGRASAELVCLPCVLAARPDLAGFLQQFKFRLVERNAGLVFACSDVSARSASMPPWIQERLKTAPRYIGRRDLAALHTELLGPLSPRTLEAWPLVWRRVGGYAVTNVFDAMAFAWERFENAPEYRNSSVKKSA
jgi:hypothetical protein